MYYRSATATTTAAMLNRSRISMCLVSCLRLPTDQSVLRSEIKCCMLHASKICLVPGETTTRRNEKSRARKNCIEEVQFRFVHPNCMFCTRERDEKQLSVFIPFCCICCLCCYQLRSICLVGCSGLISRSMVDRIRIACLTLLTIRSTSLLTAETRSVPFGIPIVLCCHY